MGIQGLLPQLKSITRSVHISDYAGQKVAVDAYSWLHKGAYACSKELCEGTPTDKYVRYCMGRVELLRRHGVIPVIVFDGAQLPMKANEESARQRSRKESLEKAAAHAAAGNSAAAVECYQRAVDISPEVAKGFIVALQLAGVQYVVAPYEADAQMAYLSRNGLVHAVISEDSDMLPYGCPRVLFKLDKQGEGQEVLLADLQHNRDLGFAGWTHTMFVELCIFAGCDFLKALPGIGLKKAYQHMRRLKDFVKVCKSMRFGGVSVPVGYEEDFQRALWTFAHQRVYCTRRKTMVHLQELPAGGLVEGLRVPRALPADDDAEGGGGGGLHFLGPLMSDEVVRGIADGSLHPFSGQVLEAYPMPPPRAPSGSSLFGGDAGPANSGNGGSGRASGGVPRKPLPVQKNGILDYFGGGGGRGASGGARSGGAASGRLPPSGAQRASAPFQQQQQQRLRRESSGVAGIAGDPCDEAGPSSSQPFGGSQPLLGSQQSDGIRPALSAVHCLSQPRAATWGGGGGSGRAGSGAAAHSAQLPSAAPLGTGTVFTGGGGYAEASEQQAWDRCAGGAQQQQEEEVVSPLQRHPLALAAAVPRAASGDGSGGRTSRYFGGGGARRHLPPPLHGPRQAAATAAAAAVEQVQGVKTAAATAPDLHGGASQGDDEPAPAADAVLSSLRGVLGLRPVPQPSCLAGARSAPAAQKRDWLKVFTCRTTDGGAEIAGNDAGSTEQSASPPVSDDDSTGQAADQHQLRQQQPAACAIPLDHLKRFECTAKSALDQVIGGAAAGSGPLAAGEGSGAMVAAAVQVSQRPRVGLKRKPTGALVARKSAPIAIAAAGSYRTEEAGGSAAGRTRLRGPFQVPRKAASGTSGSGDGGQDVFRRFAFR